MRIEEDDEDDEEGEYERLQTPETLDLEQRSEIISSIYVYPRSC